METDEKMQTVESSTTGNTMTGGDAGDRLANLTDEQRESWLETGKLPGSEPDEKKPAAAKSSNDGDKTKTENDGKTAESSTAPASEKTATDDKKAADSSPAEAAPKPGDRSAAARIAELNAEKKLLQARLADLEAKQKPAEKPEGSEKQPKAKAAPKMEDYETLEEYVQASVAHGVELTLEAERKAREVAETTAAQRERETAANKMLEDTFKVGREKHPDFDQVFTDDVPIIEGSTLDRWFMSPGMDETLRAEVMYHYATHRDELVALNKLPPSQAVRELVKLEIKLSGTPKAEAEKTDEPKPGAAAKKEKPVSQAPLPGSEVGTHGTPTEDPIAKAVATGDVASYMEAANRRELAKNSRR